MSPAGIGSPILFHRFCRVQETWGAEGTWCGRTQSPGAMKAVRPSSRKTWRSGEGPQKNGSEECRPSWSHRRMKTTGERKGTSPHTDSGQKRGNVSFLLGPWAGSSAKWDKGPRKRSAWKRDKSAVARGGEDCGLRTCTSLWLLCPPWGSEPWESCLKWKP